MKIRFSGFGGQGIVLCGLAFGKAAMLDGKNSVQTQSYGSASRGGLTKSDVCIQDDEVYDLIYDELDVVVAMSQQSYEAYRGGLAAGGTLFTESDMVTLDPDAGSSRTFSVQATDIAYKQFGRKIMANMIMMGFVNEIIGVVSHDALVRAVREHVPPGTEEKNEGALAAGRRLAAEALAAGDTAAAKPRQESTAGGDR